MAYLAFYRAFRPTSFDTVVRQEHIVTTLKNQISTGKIGHAYLFCGPRGTGKTTLAKIFARAINCESPVDGSPCGKCPTCLVLSKGASLDISEIDAASNNGVDEMRDLREKVQYPPVSGKYKVYIIDEVHMLTPSAFNAVLKTLEEPPRHAVFILATTEPQKIPATILSRCMRFDFKLIPQKDLEGLIRSVFDKTGKEYEPEAVAAIARAGAGSARDSLSIADMCSSYSAGKLTYEDVNAVLGSADFSTIADICESILSENSSAALEGVENILSTGKSVGVLVKDLLNLLNNCSIVKICKNAREIVNLPEDVFSRIEGIVSHSDGHKLLRVTEILSKAENDLRYALNGRITIETAILKCSMPETDYNIDALIGKIYALEKKLAQGVEIKVNSGIYGGVAQNAAHAQRESAKQNIAPERVDSPFEKTKSAKLVEDDAINPFERPKASVSFAQEKPAQEKTTQDKDAQPSFKRTDGVQPALWENPAKAAPKPAAVSANDKDAVFGKFIRSLRTTRKNAILFTLCMDLGNFFEGDKLVLTCESEAVYKGLTRTDNAAFIAETLAELGVNDYEVRLKQKDEGKLDRAVADLKNNFSGIDIEIK
jgi:DNA polymerase-3 subunit gamma/tau